MAAITCFSFDHSMKVVAIVVFFQYLLIRFN
uniref:Uncharacterized protein n=1 Tax=Utricularia reniformis TaxID=192314 RepID=A0A1Y0B3R9_9LAMI|nr:hypothetical protein AEK19_MT0853 [Utricularia reniformis]YP_009382284.1 hypothetical protein AEK19_MT1856 [Utricularia reniformis]ART31084.1 hypothetical protein AEK19_MT0853 [Utricularia reniformis]ART32027.1 hypothetical protein AEK19_MT1856 [Utricularia reniformis]